MAASACWFPGLLPPPMRPCPSTQHRAVLGQATANRSLANLGTSQAGGAPRRITSFVVDAITPFNLPAERIVYARRTPQGFQIETAMLEGGAPLRLTYAPGDHFVSDVLRDGRDRYAGRGIVFRRHHLRRRFTPGPLHLGPRHSDGSAGIGRRIRRPDC
jgi:hypothetical protein